MLSLISLPARAQDCAAQLEAAAAAAGAEANVSTIWVDPATPNEACTAQICTGSYDECDVRTPPLSNLQVGCDGSAG